ncbi:hypothetical protein ACFQ67_00345 [Streptomyces sp. NPDC056488]|uniref:hypothetical protein n=1 Tax=Streptomyces sp. NPDC056488 TaxID=3345836 RepID=UPI00368E5F6E
MADEGTAKQEEEKGKRRPIARIELVSKDRMPDGRLVVPVEIDGALVWAVTEGAVMDEELQIQFNRLLEYVTGCGLWGQNWGGTPPSDHP